MLAKNTDERLVNIPRMDSYVIPDIDYSFLDKYCSHNRGAESRELFLTLISYVLTSSDFLKHEKEYFSPEETDDIDIGDQVFESFEKIEPKNEKRMVPINWQVLKKLWGGSANKFVDALMKEGILQRSKFFVVGVISYKYTLNKKIVGGVKRKRIKFVSKVIEERFNRYRNDKINALAREHPIYRNLYDNVASLSFDILAAKRYASLLPEGETKESVNQRISAEENHFVIFKKDRNNRVYTNFTVNHRVLREFYSFPSNEPIYMADIGACHPWFFFSMYKEDSDEKKKFGDLFSGDGFWRNLFLLLNERVMRPEEKDAFKESFFKKIGYSITVTVLTNPIYIKFKKHFPRLVRMIEDKKYPSHADFANRNMQLESRIMFRAIEKGQFKQFLWVHDALYSTTHEIDNVVSVLKECFAEEGLYPQIDVKKITR